jgi:hypothetical protein
MSKKLKITEGQLKKLMERKHSYTDNSPEGEVEEQESTGAESAIINLDKEKEVGESRFGMGGGESIDEIADDLTRCHNDLSDLSSTMEQLTYAIDGNEKLADVSEQFDAAYVKITEALDDVSNVLSLVQEVAEREGEDEDEDYEDEDQEGSEEDEMMNESIKAIRANFKRFL